jgi:hypothetical protein
MHCDDGVGIEVELRQLLLNAGQIMAFIDDPAGVGAKRIILPLWQSPDGASKSPLDVATASCQILLRTIGKSECAKQLTWSCYIMMRTCHSVMYIGVVHGLQTPPGNRPMTNNPSMLGDGWGLRERDWVCSRKTNFTSLKWCKRFAVKRFFVDGSPKAVGGTSQSY